MAYFIGALILLVVAFVLWRLTSVGRGARSRDEAIARLLDPLVRRVIAGDAVTIDEVRDLARRPESSPMLFFVLRDKGRPELIPADCDTPLQQAEGALAYWMMHPNELQDPPEAMELVETVRRAVDGRPADFYVFRYRMPDGHWAAKNGWLLGLAGPLFPNEATYQDLPGGFSRVSDIEGTIQPSELVDWYLGMLRQKGMVSGEE